MQGCYQAAAPCKSRNVIGLGSQFSIFKGVSPKGKDFEAKSLNWLLSFSFDRGYF